MEEHDTNQGETAEGSAAHRESVRLGEVVDAVSELVAQHGAADVMWALAQVVEDGVGAMFLGSIGAIAADASALRQMARRWAVFAVVKEVAPRPRGVDMVNAIAASVTIGLEDDYTPSWRVRVAHAALVMAGIAQPGLADVAKLVKAMR